MDYIYKKNLDSIDKINKIMKDNNLIGSVYMYKYDMPVVCVDISWGDWKHDHLRLDYLLTNNGFNKIKEDTTEQDGSDCYSSTHYYV